MNALYTMIAGVVVIDQSTKLVVRRLFSNKRIQLGSHLGIQVVTGRMLLTRIVGLESLWAIWTIWILATISLLVASATLSLQAIPVGLLIGGALSHAIERSVRSRITDYLCLRFWRAFNVADLALGAGAIGLVGEILQSR